MLYFITFVFYIQYVMVIIIMFFAIIKNASFVFALQIPTEEDFFAKIPPISHVFSLTYNDVECIIFNKKFLVKTIKNLPFSRAGSFGGPFQ